MLSEARKRFFKNGIIMTAVGLALRTVGLIFAAYISREVGAEGVGLSTLITTVYSFALTFATSGISLTVTRLVASHIGDGDIARVSVTLRSSFLYALIFSGVATVVLASLSGFFASSVIGDTRAVLPLQILSLSLIPEALGGVISGYFVGVRRVGRSSLVSVVGQAFRMALTVYLLMSLGSRGVEQSVSVLAIGLSITSFLTFLVALAIFFIDRYRAKARGGIDLLEIAGTALPLSTSAYIRQGLLSVEHSIIPKRLELRGDTMSEALASFGTLHGMALPMLTYPMSPLSSFSGLLVPEFAEAEARGEGIRLSRVASEAIATTLKYATVVAVLLFLFSEDLGYAIYSSYDAGYYIAFLAPVVPIMYLDHVTDAILKGIGEQVYSMWVNILDSALSVLLVWVLIPIFGIAGYAIVIIVMEGFNFILSYLKLRERIKPKLTLIPSVIIPLISSATAAFLVSRLFIPTGSAVTLGFIVLKLVFALCVTFAISIPLSALISLAHNRRDK